MLADSSHQCTVPLYLVRPRTETHQMALYGKDNFHRNMDHHLVFFSDSYKVLNTSSKYLSFSLL